MTAMKLNLRLRAAGWAALAGGACGGLFGFAYLRDQDGSAFIIAGLTLAAALGAGVSGFLVGWHLFDPDEHHEADDAIGLGLGTATLAYPLTFAGLVLAFTVGGLLGVNGPADPDWEAAPIARYTFMFTHERLITIVFGSWIAMMFTSWVTLPLGGLAGYILSRRYRKGPAPRTSIRVSRWCGCSGILIFVLPWLFCVAPIPANELVNNVRLHIFASPLFSYPVPPNTEVISRSAEVAHYGNGNNCDFFATQHMRTTLSQEQIEEYYRAVRLPRVLTLWEPKRAGDSDIFLFFDGTEDGLLLFRASLGDIGYSAGFDMRCN